MFLPGNDNRAYLYLLQGFIGPPHFAWLEGGPELAMAGWPARFMAGRSKRY